ncbi:MAG: nucleotidyltransferase family protein [Planctomycetes bacterium]|nr:nucleotidyltransferase family protein [Planctomycetota bacterium]
MITPLILAAGESTRMGRPKALLEFGGRTALDLVLRACRELGDPIVVVGAHADAIRARVPVDAVVNPAYARGQTSSLKVGLRNLPAGTEAFLLYPVDFPLVTAAQVGRLAGAWARRGPKARIIIPSHDGRRGHPVVFDAFLREEFLRLADEAPARAVVRAHAEEIAYVTFDEPDVLMDMDTPEDYARCLKRWREIHGRQSSGDA